MRESTKIELRYRRVQQIGDIVDLVEILFPGNRNQQHAAARILIALRKSDGLVPSLTFLEQQHDISRRTLQRARAKLSRLGMIERVTWMNRRYHGQEGWKLSTRLASSLRRLASFIDAWSDDDEGLRTGKDAQLVELLH